MNLYLRSLLLLTCLLGFSSSTRAIGLIIVQDDGLPDPASESVMPRPWWPRPIHRFTPLELRSVKLTGTIKDQVARTRIEQEFYNGNPRRLEGTFILPLPKGAHLQKFALEINGQMAEAELLSAEKAKGIYEEIVRKAKDPALLEYVGRDLLKVRIFPIEPNSTKKIELTYDQVLKNDSGLTEYSLPCNTAQYAAGTIGSFAVKLEIASSTPLKSIYSPSHSVEILRNTDRTATIGFEEKNAKPNKDFQLFYSAESSSVGVNLLSYKEPGEDGYFMLLASPGFDQKRGEILPKDIVFVLDTSGSMAGAKLTQAKKALSFCVSNLNNDDRFEIIRFSTEGEALFKALTAVSADSRKEAEQFIESLKPIGGTAIDEALKKALAVRPEKGGRPFMVVFLTDGLPTVGETSVDKIVSRVSRDKEDLTRVFCFGIGTDVNTQLLDRIAEETSAVSQYVLPDEDLELKVSSFFTKISDPVLAGLELDFDGIRTSRMHPGKLPDLFKGQQLVVLGRFSGGGAATAKLRGKVGDNEREFSYKLQFPEKTTEHSFIPRLWATRRVGYLLEEIRLRGENAELKNEITELARKHGIVTPYTSYLVQEDQPVPAQASANDPTAFYRRNPELMKRYFPTQNAPAPERARNLFAPQSRSGETAVAGARYSGALKSAQTEQELVLAGREVQQYTSGGRLASRADASSFAEQLTKTAAGRLFHRQDDLWIEASVIPLLNPSVITLTFDSKEYWTFVHTHPDLREVFALGTQIKLLLDGKVYEIVPPNFK